MTDDLPEGYTLDAPIQHDLPAGYALDNNSLEQTNQPSAPPLATDGLHNIIQRFGNDVSNRYQNIKNISNQVNSGQVAPSIGEIGKIGETAAGMFADPMKEVGNTLAAGIGKEIKSNYQSLPDAVTHPISESVTEAINSPFVQQGIKNFKDVGSLAKQKLDENPNAATLLGAGVNLGSAALGVGPTVSSLGAVGDAVGAAGRSALSPLVNALEKSGATTMPQNSADLFWEDKVNPDLAKNIRDQHYNFAAGQGNAFDESVLNAYKSKVNDLFQSPNKKTLASAVQPVNALQGIINNINNAEGPVTLQDFQKFRSDLNQFYTPIPTAESRQAAMLKNALDDTIASAPESARYSGTKAGWDALDNGNSAHGAYKTLTSLKEGMDDAAGRAQPSASLDTFLRKFAKNNPDALTADEKDMVKSITNPTASKVLLRGASGRLLPLAGGAAAMLIPGSGVAEGIVSGSGLALAGQAARNISYGKKLVETEKLVNSIGKRIPKFNPNLSEDPIVPSHPSTGGFSMGDPGRSTYYPPSSPIQEVEDPFAATPSPVTPDLMQQFFKNKASGGAVKNKMGFKLKSKGK